jgi:hypothetical protein
VIKEIRDAEFGLGKKFQIMSSMRENIVFTAWNSTNDHTFIPALGVAF